MKRKSISAALAVVLGILSGCAAHDESYFRHQIVETSNFSDDYELKDISALPPVIRAAATGDIDSVKTYLDQGANPEAPIGEHTLVLAAVRMHQHAMLRYLISRGASAAACDPVRGNPVEFASDPETVLILLEAGADPISTCNDKVKWGPVCSAVWTDNAEGLRYLIGYGAIHSGVICLEASPLEFAKHWERWKTYAVLMESPAPGVLKAELDRKRSIDAYASAESIGTIEAYEAFVEQNPSSPRRGHALSEAARLALAVPGSRDTLGRLASKFPDFIVYIPADQRLYYIGPSALPLYKIIDLKREGIGDTLVITKIRAQRSGYKDFELEEIKLLKSKGLSEDIINEMIALTARLASSEENAALRAEIETLKRHVSELQSRPPAQSLPSSAGAPQSGSGGNSNALLNCTAQITALELCNNSPGGAFGREICRAAAKAQFPCTQ